MRNKMSKKFTLANFSDSTYQYISLFLSYESLDYAYSELENELKVCNAKGRILLDFLLSNGLNSDRFASIYFNGYRLEFDSFRIEMVISSKVEIFCEEYFKSNPQHIEKSVLSKPQKFLLKKGRLSKKHNYHVDLI